MNQFLKGHSRCLHFSQLFALTGDQYLRLTYVAYCVCAWVKELEALPYNPVLVFKAQGEPQQDHMNNIGKNDFLLGLQTQFQRDMLIKHGGVCVCMDATHGTNM